MINCYDFYGLPVKFNIDEQELKRKYHEKLKSNHPDFFVHDAEKHKEALINSSLNNEAYKCLSDFYRRAVHLISINSIEFSEKLPADFLMEMMDINELLEDVKAKPAQDEIQKVSSLITQIESDLKAGLSEKTKIFDHTDPVDANILNDVRDLLLKHKYILRLKETLANIAAP